ncbi:hypothetical protein LTR24_008630 [Lithohypha guttulata]|uniref:Uncharacterized protein n=1 Tax=Lithohypha guttulata TaxID=1690604 RepID=A0ABR0K198_9EURO|nr:hypothetical protein LTR24_008630 [Lithohypha guttulata]
METAALHHLPPKARLNVLYVPAILPLAHSESTPDIDTIEVAGTNFSLYHGWNAQGQNVFSWLAHRKLTESNADYSPLLRYSWEEKALLSGALHLGQLEFGTEVMHAGLTTTFEASNYELKLYREGDEDDPLPKTTSTTEESASATATSTGAESGAAEASTTGMTGPAATSLSASPGGVAAFPLHQMFCIGCTMRGNGVVGWSVYERYDMISRINE